MGRGKDLTNNERTTVHTLMKKNWNYEQNQFKHKGRSLTLKECEMYGVRLSVETTSKHDYKQAHNNSRNLIKTTGTPIDLRVDLEDYDRCFDLLNGV